MIEHIVVVTDSLAVNGGSANVALRSAMALAESGLQVTVFAATGQASLELTSCKNLRIVTTGQVEALMSRNRLMGALRGLWNVQAYKAMNDLLATLDPQRTVVHLHGWTKALSSSVVASIVRAKFPIVLTLHEFFTACPTGCMYLHRDGQLCTLRPMSLACIVKDCDSRNYTFKLYRVLRQLVQLTIGRIPSGIAHYITVSDFSRRLIEPLLPQNSKIYGVNNPVEVAHGPRVRAEDNDTFVFVGRLSAEKGCVVLAEAARIAGVKALFIGDGSERARIVAVNPDAAFTGWLDKAGVVEALRGARAIVVPSLWYETLGLVVLEAAGLGVPAIVPKGTAAFDLISEGRTGLAFERGDPHDLAAQLRAFADHEVVARLSREAYEQFWIAPPTMRTHVADLLDAYEDMVGVVATSNVVARAS